MKTGNFKNLESGRGGISIGYTIMNSLTNDSSLAELGPDNKIAENDQEKRNKKWSLQIPFDNLKKKSYFFPAANHWNTVSVVSDGAVQRLSWNILNLFLRTIFNL